MVINYDIPGQLCNRIWSVVPSIAYGLESSEKVLLINFDEYIRYFDDLNKNRYVKFASRKFLRKIIHSFKVRGYIQNGKPNIFMRLFGLNFIEGWPNILGNQQMVQRQADNIREIFRFGEDITSAVDSQLLPGGDDTILVGIHIRRGDYREWLSGKYYYTDEVYRRAMKEMEHELARIGKKARFLLCSNEKINPGNFSDLDCFTIVDTTGEKDLYALSRCNYIIGAPSTYSEWASFIGKVPVKYLMTENEKIMLPDFSRIVSFNKFENGNDFALN
ncbi:alpha-1,2-fucosyltransferase [Dysgonomonas sp. 511]|uniref:alpha-1,2-fucosyltransferase n=1 Tax=Dysgonomonas sp. 511 TaxID=2302930 RepID=UPI0013D01B53|nr:alpha-1,2-fucosyltransferase [Dysgonomonas sp. 511]NDV79187.1 hypothetical protein [Dysgonomonas sp. 511]